MNKVGTLSTSLRMSWDRSIKDECCKKLSELPIHPDGYPQLAIQHINSAMRQNAFATVGGTVTYCLSSIECNEDCLCWTSSIAEAGKTREERVGLR